jgi:hypothetical protein
MSNYNFKPVTVVVGHYGSGKTNVAANIAFYIASIGAAVSVADLDIVNPYFRTADVAELFAERGIELIVSRYANGNLDIPALHFGLSDIANTDRYYVLDVGGDDEGAKALGRYSHILSALPHDKLDVLYVTNMYRPLTRQVSDVLANISEIETSGSVRVTGIINNSNLGNETTPEIVSDSIPYARELSEKLCLPVIKLPFEFTNYTKNFY